MNSTCNMNPSDIYAQMIEVNAGRRGCMTVTKKDAKKGYVQWSFIESAASILGLEVRRDGRWGYLISLAAK